MNAPQDVPLHWIHMNATQDLCLNDTGAITMPTIDVPIRSLVTLPTAGEISEKSKPATEAQIDIHRLS